MAGKVLGLCTCPECDFPDAEIKEDKNGHPYRYCPDCNVQTFSRGEPKRAQNMLKKMRPLPGNGNTEPAAPAAKPVTNNPPPPAAKKSGFALDQL